jgi:hypothetical protein
MTIASLTRTGLPSAGIYLGPAAWLLNFVTGYALVPWICAHQIRLIPLLAGLTFCLAIAGGLLSLQAYRRPAIAEVSDRSGAGRPHRFTALMGMAIALLFAAVILVQGAAGLVFQGCER